MWEIKKTYESLGVGICSSRLERSCRTVKPCPRDAVLGSAKNWIINLHQFVDGADLTSFDSKIREVVLQSIGRKQTDACTKSNRQEWFNWEALNKVFELGLEGSHCEGKC